MHEISNDLIWDGDELKELLSAAKGLSSFNVGDRRRALRQILNEPRFVMCIWEQWKRRNVVELLRDDPQRDPGLVALASEGAALRDRLRVMSRESSIWNRRLAKRLTELFDAGEAVEALNLRTLPEQLAALQHAPPRWIRVAARRAAPAMVAHADPEFPELHEEEKELEAFLQKTQMPTIGPALGLVTALASHSFSAPARPVTGSDWAVLGILILFAVLLAPSQPWWLRPIVAVLASLLFSSLWIAIRRLMR